MNATEGRCYRLLFFFTFVFVFSLSGHLLSPFLRRREEGAKTIEHDTNGKSVDPTFSGSHSRPNGIVRQTVIHYILWLYETWMHSPREVLGKLPLRLWRSSFPSSLKSTDITAVYIRRTRSFAQNFASELQVLRWRLAHRNHDPFLDKLPRCIEKRARPFQEMSGKQGVSTSLKLRLWIDVLCRASLITGTGINSLAYYLLSLLSSCNISL